MLDDDDEETLHERIKVAERSLVVDTVGRMVRDGWSVQDRIVRIGQLTRVAIRRALISVYDKTGLSELAAALHAAGVQIVSTGSTAATIAAAGVPVTPVEELTGFPECLDGRVKTLHPAVHAGLLADLAKDSHREQLAELRHRAVRPAGVQPVPVRADRRQRRQPGRSASSRSTSAARRWSGPAAKNHATVAVVTSPARYPEVLAALADGGFTLEQRRRLAAQAYAHTAAYDAAVSSWFASVYAPDEVAAETGWPDVTGAVWTRKDVLRYGENPHQRAALYLRSGGSRAAARRRDRRRRGAARQGHVVQQLRRRRRGPPGGVRLQRAVRGDHEARQPVRHRARRRPRRSAPQWRTPATRCRRSAA